MQFALDPAAYETVIRRLPKSHLEDRKLIFEYDQGFLRVRRVPQHVHECLCGRAGIIILSWANYSNTADPPLLAVGSTDYTWSPPGYQKYPACSFRPLALTMPPTKPKLGGEVINGRVPPYPTLVFELVHDHESWRQFKADASQKAFSESTSIHVFIGVKVYKEHLRAFWGVRRENG
jgi:hypothetical protein